MKANSLSLVNFDCNRYSVPVEYSFGRLTLYAYAWSVEIACGDRGIATHPRCYDSWQDIMEVDHYLPLLIQRPGAFPYAKPVRQWRMPAVYRECYEALCRNRARYGVRDFLRVLALGRMRGKDTLEKAMAQALAEKWVTSERIRQLVYGEDLTANHNVMRDQLGQAKVVLPDLGQFDRLRTMAAAGGSR